MSRLPYRSLPLFTSMKKYIVVSLCLSILASKNIKKLTAIFIIIFTPVWLQLWTSLEESEWLGAWQCTCREWGREIRSICKCWITGQSIYKLSGSGFGRWFKWPVLRVGQSPSACPAQSLWVESTGTTSLSLHLLPYLHTHSAVSWFVTLRKIFFFPYVLPVFAGSEEDSQTANWDSLNKGCSQWCQRGCITRLRSVDLQHCNGWINRL